MALNEIGLSVGDERDGYRVSRVINAATGRYVWQTIAISGTGVQDVTPTPLPVDLAALTLAVPPGSAPASAVARYGTAPDFQLAQVVAGVWAAADTDAIMTGATALLPGTSGRVPASVATTQDLLLHADGQWRSAAPDWVTARAYSAGALVVNNGGLFRRITAGTSLGTFALDAGNWTPIGSAVPERVHLTNTAVNPATPGAPTLAELTAAVGANRDTICYYTGDDLPASNPTYVVHVDGSGDVTLLRSPGTGRVQQTVNVTARNTLANLAQTPTGAVEWHVNGVTVLGITVAGVAVTVNAATVGFNIDPGIDVVTAEYPI